MRLQAHAGSKTPVFNQKFKPTEKTKPRFRLYIDHEFEGVYESQDACELRLHEWQLDACRGAQNVCIQDTADVSN